MGTLRLKQGTHWGDGHVKDVKLTEEQYKGLCEKVIAIGKHRHRGQGKHFNEPDFLAGAMAAMEALNIGCPTWPFAIMCGTSIISPKEDE